jgi:hypothetical protein
MLGWYTSSAMSTTFSRWAKRTRSRRLSSVRHWPVGLPGLMNTRARTLAPRLLREIERWGGHGRRQCITEHASSAAGFASAQAGSWQTGGTCGRIPDPPATSRCFHASQAVLTARRARRA